jgi:hypothetical protein
VTAEQLRMRLSHVAPLVGDDLRDVGDDPWAIRADGIDDDALPRVGGKASCWGRELRSGKKDDTGEWT